MADVRYQCSYEFERKRNNLFDDTALTLDHNHVVNLHVYTIVPYVDQISYYMHIYQFSDLSLLDIDTHILT